MLLFIIAFHRRIFGNSIGLARNLLTRKKLPKHYYHMVVPNVSAATLGCGEVVCVIFTKLIPPTAAAANYKCDRWCQNSLVHLQASCACMYMCSGMYRSSEWWIMHVRSMGTAGIASYTGHRREGEKQPGRLPVVCAHAYMQICTYIECSATLSLAMWWESLPTGNTGTVPSPLTANLPSSSTDQYTTV